MKKNINSHFYKGSTYIYVIGVFLVVSMLTTLSVSQLNQSIYENHAYNMQMQCYYLTYEAADATVYVLTDDYKENRDLLRHMDYPQTNEIKHYDPEVANPDESDIIGVSSITVTKEIHDYYGEDREWAVATITTTIPDKRGSRMGEDFSYVGSVMILMDNPVVQIYNINPNSF